MTLGSKLNRFAIPELECSWVVISFAARSLGSKKPLRTSFMVYIYNYLMLINFFSYTLLLIVFAKAFYFSFIIFLLWTSLWSVRPVVGYILMISLCRVSSFQPFVSFLLLVFLFFVLVVSFSQK